MSKPEAKTITYYDVFEVQDYLNEVEPGLGERFWDALAEYEGMQNDCYHRWYPGFYGRHENAQRRVCEIMGWTEGQRIVFWVSW